MTKEMYETFKTALENTMRLEYYYWKDKKAGNTAAMEEDVAQYKNYQDILLEFQKTLPELAAKLFYYRYGMTTMADLGEVKPASIILGWYPEFEDEGTKERFVSLGSPQKVDFSAVRKLSNREKYAIINTDEEYLLEHQDEKFLQGVMYKAKIMYIMGKETTVTHGNIDVDASVRAAESAMDWRERQRLGGFTVEQHAAMGHVADPLGYVDYENRREQALSRYRDELESKNTSYDTREVYYGMQYEFRRQGYVLIDPMTGRFLLTALDLDPQDPMIIQTRYYYPFTPYRGADQPDPDRSAYVVERKWDASKKESPDHAGTMLYLINKYVDRLSPVALLQYKPIGVSFPKVWCYFMRKAWLHQHGVDID